VHLRPTTASTTSGACVGATSITVTGKVCGAAAAGCAALSPLQADSSSAAAISTTKPKEVWSGESRRPGRTARREIGREAGTAAAERTGIGELS